MDSQDQNYGAGAEAAHQADAVQNQMAAEAIADAPAAPQEDNSILAGISADEEMRSLSDVIHEGSPSTQPNTGSFVSNPAPSVEPPVKEKQSGSKNPLIIAVVAVLVLAGVGLGIWALLSNNNDSGTGGSKADPDRMAFFMEGENGNTSYAIYNDKGEKLSDAIYEKVSDFNKSGYAIAKKVDNDAIGMISNTGKMSVAYGEYESAEAFGPFFIVSKDGSQFLTRGDGENIMNIVNTDAQYGLYSVYDGAQSTIFDKEGNIVGKTEFKKPLTEAIVSRNTICSHYEGTTRCFDTNSGEKVLEFQTDKNLSISYLGEAVSSSRQCMFLQDGSNRSKRIMYLYGKIISFEDNGEIMNGSYDDSCFFHKNDYVMGSDLKKIYVKPLNTTASQLVIRDSEHYAYYTMSDGGQYALHIHMNGKDIVYDTKNYTPNVSSYGDYISVSYYIPSPGGVLYNYYAVFKDDAKPIYEIKNTEYPTIDAISFMGIDENRNFFAGRSLMNLDKGAIYQFDGFLGYYSYEDGVYLVRGERMRKQGETYLAVVDKNGKEIIPYEKYETIQKEGKYFVAKKGNNYSLIDLSGKVILENRDSIVVTNSHFEALEGGKIEYYTLDGNKIK